MTQVKNTELSVAFIGLGAMGYRMASHLPKAFQHVFVWNRTFSKAEQHTEAYGTQAVSLKTAVSADIIFSCLPTSMEVEQIIESNLPKRESVWVDCTSGVPDSAKKLTNMLFQNGSFYLDAPVSGQTIGAEKGTLTVMIGGDEKALNIAKPAIDCFAGLIEHVGDSGSGFAVKAVNNTLLAANLWAASEGLSVLKAHGVNLSSALNCINASSGQSLASSNIIPNRVINRSFPNTFALDLLAKDTRIASQLQIQTQTPTPVLAQVSHLCQSASNQHEAGSADFSEFVKLLEKMTRLTLE